MALLMCIDFTFMYIIVAFFIIFQISFCISWLLLLAVVAKFETAEEGLLGNSTSGESSGTWYCRLFFEYVSHSIPATGGVLLEIFGGGVPPSSRNPDLISDQKMSFMSFLPLQIRNSFEYWAALPELVYWAQKKIVITKWSEMVQGKGPEPV